jgi:hypothetical protein
MNWSSGFERPKCLHCFKIRRRREGGSEKVGEVTEATVYKCRNICILHATSPVAAAALSQRICMSTY